MSSLFRSTGLKSRLCGGLLLAGVFAGGTSSSFALAEPQIAGSSAQDQPLPIAAHQGVVTSLSPGIADVLKMADAKLDADVIRAFVKNSPTPYDPTVSEIIALKEHGLSSEIITALIERGGELRAQMAKARESKVVPAAQPPYPNAATPYPVEPSYGYDTAQPVYAAYPYPYPVYSYSYLYPGYAWWYNCGYPGPYCSPSLRLAFYSHYGYRFPRYYSRGHAFDHNLYSPIRGGRLPPVHNPGFQPRGGFTMRPATMPSHGGTFRVASVSGGRAMRRGR